MVKLRENEQHLVKEVTTYRKEESCNVDSPTSHEKVGINNDEFLISQLTSLQLDYSNQSIDKLVMLNPNETEHRYFVVVDNWLKSMLPYTNIFYSQLKSKPIRNKHILTLVDENIKIDENRLSFLAMLVYDALSNHLEIMMYTTADISRNDDNLTSSNENYNKVVGYVSDVLRFVKRTFLTSSSSGRMTSIEIGGTDPALYQLVKESGFITERSFHLYNVFTLEDLDSLKNVKIKPLPEGYSISPLSQEHADLLNDNWLYKTENTIHLVREWIRLGYGKCIKYKNPNDRNQEDVVCWALVYDYGSVGLLYNIESHRGLGLAKIVIYEILSQVIEQLQNGTEHSHGLLSGGVYCHIYPDNQASKALFTSLGFSRSFDAVWNVIEII